ncbi:hypothetical protein MXAN_1802 [Myxococcus xanthus DK 1622]|uniref:Uncharacterized protein n=1 Tax=Myxococcus xanthus (strain DK1622) TaxID=246197 RepID=Q1DBC5_MYXXD|nr:hypothetical protein MXAN_1802 [Myxococcus xanthus DK 1622]
MRWLHGTADLNRQGSGTATVRVSAPGLYRVRSVASARRARDAYVKVTEEDGALHATVLGVDEQVPRTTGPVLQDLEERFGTTSARAERAVGQSASASCGGDCPVRGSSLLAVPGLHAAGIGRVAARRIVQCVDVALPRNAASPKLDADSLAPNVHALVVAPPVVVARNTILLPQTGQLVIRIGVAYGAPLLRIQNQLVALPGLALSTITATTRRHGEHRRRDRNPLHFRSLVGRESSANQYTRP